MDTPFALGRVVEHDPRSKAYPAPASGDIRKVSYRHYGAVLDQGDTSSCTGNASAQCLNTNPFKVKGRTFREKDALRFYSEATELDGYPGHYPPDDDGSSGLAAAKALRAEGWISSFTHGFGIDHVLGSLMLKPGISGTMWHQSMFEPDANGFVHPDGNEVGGHEYLLLGVDPDKRFFTFLNSWSKTWGDRGRFYMTFEDYDALLRNQGDVVFFQQ